MLDTMRGLVAGRPPYEVWRVTNSARALLKPYGVAALCIAVALGLSLALRGIVDPTGLFLVAIAIGTWSTGWQVGLVAAGLATIAFDYFFTNPLYSVLVTRAEIPRLAAFTFCALAVNWASDARRIAVTRTLRDTERRLAALFDDAPVGIAFIDSSGHAFRTNRKLQDMFGYSAREFERFPFTKIMHAPGMEADWNVFAELVGGTKQSYRIEKHCVTRNGSTLWTQLTVSLVRGDRGEPLFGIAFMEDITGRKSAASDRRLFAQRLPTPEGGSD
jgi:PAS domain S-box-containing protein